MKAKRVLSLALALCLCAGLLVMPALAAGDFTIEGGVLTKYSGPGGNVVIPDGVTEIGKGAFAYCDSLTSVTIPNSVTAIGENAFWLCPSLTSITIPDGVTAIGHDAFYCCTGLTSVTLPDSVTTIDSSAFSGCTGLTSVTIPDGVTTIDKHVFARCKSLTSVTIPDGVTSIGYKAFAGCTGLTSVTIPDSVTTIGEDAFYLCTGLTGVNIPDSVTTIGEWAFGRCENLADITIPDSVTTIGEGVFYSCESLTSVTLPDSVTSIGKDVFSDCFRLTDIYFSGSETQWKNIFINQPNDELRRATIHYNAAAPTPSVQPQKAYASTQKVQVDGRAVEFQCYALKDQSGNDTNYIKLRDLADILNGSAAQFQVGWDGSVTITTKQAYTPNGSEGNTPFSGDRAYQEATAATKVNGQSKDLAAFVLNDDQGGGYTYYQLRDLAQALGFNVGWSADKGIYVETGKPYDPNN